MATFTAIRNKKQTAGAMLGVLSYQEVNTIGLELAQKAFPGHEVVIATHMDTNHLHNHLVVNSVSCVNGRKLHQNRDNLLRHRQLNDEICMAHGLRVLVNPEKYTRKKRMKPGEYQAGLRGDSWKLDDHGENDFNMRM